MPISSTSSSSLMLDLVRLCEPIKESLAATPYSPPKTYSHVSVKSHLQSLLPEPLIPEANISGKVNDFVLLCAALASASKATTQHLSWIPDSLSLLAVKALKEFAGTWCEHYLPTNCSIKVSELELDLDLSGEVEVEKKLLIKLFAEIVPLLKVSIKESSADVNDEDHETCAASAGVPVAYAILAASQFRWLVTQVDVPFIGKLCPLVIPCALTCLDHWSPQVKDQGMTSLIHLAKNVKEADVGGFGDVILDACCQNIACDDDIWPYAVEMSVLVVTLTQKCNPRSQWYDKLVGEMLSHLERQPGNKKRRIAWLMHCEHLFSGLGLTVLVHFRRLFALFFKWMHADDDETVFLVLESAIAVLRLTWMRTSPLIERFIDELVVLYKHAALKSGREKIRSLVFKALNLLQMIMYGRKASELVREFATCEPGQISSFNNDLFAQVLEECDGHLLHLQPLIRKIQEQENTLRDVASQDGSEVSEDERLKTEELKTSLRSALKSDQFGALVHHLSLVRNKRCLMAYVYNRAEMIRSLGWMVDSVLPGDIQDKLSTAEKDYFKKHVATLQSYMAELDLLLTVDMIPPKDPFVKVRVIDDIGQVALSDQVANLSKHAIMFLRRTDAEQYITQGQMEELPS